MLRRCRVLSLVLFCLTCPLLNSATAFACDEATNVALAANGATATASSAYDPAVCGSGAVGANDGDRTGRARCNNRVWNDAAPANTFSNDWLQIDFNGSKTITEIDVITVQDHLEWPVEPTQAMTFSQYGLTAFEVQYWNNSTWVTVPGGNVSGNNNVWRKFTFAALTTSKIRVRASASPDGYSRIVELEAWTGPSPAPRYDLALGGTATASTSYPGWGASAVINGDRKSLNAYSNGAWSSAAANNFPEWVQVDFGANKTINEIHVFTLQDNWAGSTEPTPAMSFTLYGLSGYEVQWWTGSSWLTVPGGNVTGNNKIWRTFTFSPITTSKIKVLSNAAPDGISRITEIEAYAPQSSSCGTEARLDPLNQTGGGGENPLSRNFNWRLPLVSLPGRAGMDLGLTLSYNSLVWTKSGNYISFDDDRGFPGPGFRLGFPVIQPIYYNTEVGKYAFLLIGPDGSRTELRQVGVSALYEAADSSHLLLDSSTMVLRTADGTQLSYSFMGNEFNCTQIKERNGNYLTINYTASGRIDTVIDTLARSIKFIYQDGLLIRIEQIWNQGSPSQVTHNWATFTYSDTTIQTNYAGLTVLGVTNGSIIKTLSKVTLADYSHSEFSYTSWGQVWKVSNFAADNHLLNHRSYNLPQTAGTAQTDCPRFTERRDWAQYWNGDTDGTAAANEEAVTAFIAPVSETWTMPDGTQGSGTRAQVTTPDLTVNKIYFIGTAGTTSGWQRGLPALVETHSGGTWQRKVMTIWEQDAAASFPLNPRVKETNIYDPAGNRARTRIEYEQVTFTNGTSCRLPRDVFEYASNATTILRSTRTDYHPSAIYKDRRILGLVMEKRLYEGDLLNGGTLMSKVGFFYDNENGASSIQGTDAPVQHDNTNYSATFVTGRANLSSVRRYDVTNTLFTTTSAQYNTGGAVVSSMDALNHTVTISYADSFSDGNNSRNTLAYPTTVVDPDGFSSSSKYQFDFGGLTRRQTPLPNVTTNTPGPEQSFAFDTIGRLQQVTNLVNNAYTRFEYPNSQIRVDTFTTIQEGLGEAHSFAISDGHGRMVASATDHPGSIGGFSGEKTVYDIMGRVIKTSNPTETNASGAPSQWTTAGDDAAAGWIYTEQTYDWKGRPLVTTNQDGATKTASYAGCGCAGGEVITLTDEGILDGGVTKKRQQKIYSDVLGRTVKSEILNWEGGSVYSATVNTYNVRDQLILIRQYAGAEGSGTFQDTTMSYDGFGRLQTRHEPEQNAGTNTVWAYRADDTINTITDARGAITTFGYAGTNRKLVTAITSTLTGQPNVMASFSYDAAGNRTAMTDGLGTITYQYDQLSRLVAETRGFTGLGNHTISYQYNLTNELSSITDPLNTTVSYTRDTIGRLTSIARPSQTFASGISYRASGAMKYMLYGNNSAMNVTFNGRLQPATFSVSMQISKTYTYNNDGTLRFSSDLMDHTFDRSYGFDQVGRLITALSGPEARGEGTTSFRPYNQSYGYDAFGHLNQRIVKTWWSGFSTMSVTYVNNRHQGVGWQYDADGRALDGNEHLDYDAAGRNNFLDGYGHGTVARSFDGDGRQCKTVETYLDEELNEHTETKYYVRSSVLGGQVLAEVDEFNSILRRFVYAGPTVLAWISGTGVFETTLWEHRDPTGATVRGIGAQELDPLGADAGTFDNAVPPTERALTSYGSSYSPANSAVSYSVDGIRVPANDFMNFAGVDLQNPVGLLDSFARASGQPIGKRNTGVSWGRPFEVIYDANGETVSQTWGDFDPELGALNFGTESLIYSNEGLPNLALLPQNSTVGREDVSAYRGRIEKMLQNPDCASFIQKLLDEAKAQTGRPYSDISTTFDKIKFFWGPGQSYAHFDQGVPAATIRNTIITERPSGSLANQNDRRGVLTSQTTQSFLGETIHHVGQGFAYRDGVLANAMNAILVSQKLDTPKIFSDLTPTDVDNASIYWHPKVWAACPAPRK